MATMAERGERSRKVNLAIWRLITGRTREGGIAADLADLTGLTHRAIIRRYQAVEYTYPDHLKEDAGLTNAERKTIAKIYSKSDRPEVQEFVAQLLSN